MDFASFTVIFEDDAYLPLTPAMHTGITPPPSLTGPSVAVLLADIGAVLQQHAGAVQEAQRDREVERGPTARVQRLQIRLEGRGRRRGWSWHQGKEEQTEEDEGGGLRGG